MSKVVYIRAFAAMLALVLRTVWCYYKRVKKGSLAAFFIRIFTK